MRRSLQLMKSSLPRAASAERTHSAPSFPVFSTDSQYLTISASSSRQSTQKTVVPSSSNAAIDASLGDSKTAVMRSVFMRVVFQILIIRGTYPWIYIANQLAEPQKVLRGSQ